VKFVSTGISISSINRIKELAEEKKYAEALEILDTQNLDKSINPQFLRISGEIFRENKRYYDSRKILLKSHQMSPQGIRIIYELIQLYLELGYFTKASKYYEQYMFYSTKEDVQRDYVEYMMKKATGADIKELAAILIPILERMPDDKWNFEAVLLYDKMGRKDKALEECKYILENFKDSAFVEPSIQYIDDELDVDECFYIYPREEVAEDEQLFGDLITQEDNILKEDYLRMYPPEARIMVEAEDKEGFDAKPVKEKKTKKAKKRKTKEKENNTNENTDTADKQNEPDSQLNPKDDKSDSDEEKQVNDIPVNISEKVSDDTISEQASLKYSEENTQNAEKEEITEEEQIRQEREAALDKLLSKKMNTEQIKESARQVANAVKEIDAEKAKHQVKSVAESVKDNVKKATNVLSEAVGAKTAYEDLIKDTEGKESALTEEIVDGIIESVLEPPKKVVGQVVMNEELDALIPDSLEAMSAEEIAEIETRKEEAERMELEALEASLRLEEEKKSKKKNKDNSAEPSQETDQPDNLQEDVQTEKAFEDAPLEENIHNTLGDDLYSTPEGDFSRLRAQFLEELEEEEEKPLESLGFITVVQSDVDQSIEEDIPETAELLHQMIDNKEFYTGEDSTKFESKASYENHGFEVEDYEFEAYRYEEKDMFSDETAEEKPETDLEKSASVEMIYAQEDIVDFDEIIPGEAEKPDLETDKDNYENDTASQEKVISEKEPIFEEILISEENVWTEEPVVSPEPVSAEDDVRTEEPAVRPEPVSVEDDVWTEEPALEAETVREKSEAWTEKTVQKSELLSKDMPSEEKVVFDNTVIESEINNESGSDDMEIDKATKDDRREQLRIRILLSDDMVRTLTNLKESR